MKKLACVILIALAMVIALNGCSLTAACNTSQSIITHGNMAVAQTRATATAIDTLNPGAIPESVWRYLDQASIGLAMAQAAHDVACRGR